MVTICTNSLIFNNSTFCPHSVFMCFVRISEQTAIISLYNINFLVFITEECVYCAVRTVVHSNCTDLCTPCRSHSSAKIKTGSDCQPVCSTVTQGQCNYRLCTVWVRDSLWEVADKQREQCNISRTCTLVHCRYGGPWKKRREYERRNQQDRQRTAAQH